MANARNFIVWDFETTGVIPGHHEVVQIAARALNAWDLSDHHAGKFSLYLKPDHPERAEPGALKVIGEVWDKALAEGVNRKVGWQKYLEWCASVNQTKNSWGKPLKVGFNANFDRDFEMAELEQQGLVLRTKGEEYPWSWTIDVMMNSILLFETDPNVKSFNLNAMAELLGMKRETRNHDAVEDVDLTTEIFRRQMKFFRECQKKIRISK